MATGVNPIASAWHAHVQAGVVAVQHAVDRAQILKGPVVDGRLSRLRRDAYANRTLAVEFAVRAPADLPETIHAAGHDGVVGPAQ